MARYHGPKARINRRLSTMVFESSGAARAAGRRENPPGMHVKGGGGRRMSNYGLAAAEKQKIKYYYGIAEKQLRRFFANASAQKGNTGENLMTICERRLDNVVRRAGYTRTRPQARQGIVHGHFFVNGVKVTSPSYQLRPGDVITVRANEAIYNVYKEASTNSSTTPPDWVTFDNETLRATVQRIPGPGDYSLPANVNIVVEFLSR